MDELQLVDITYGNPDHHRLFERAYHEILHPEFADWHSDGSLPRYFNMLSGNKPGVELIANVAGRNLHSPKKAELLAVSLAYYYNLQNVGLLEFNAVSPNAHAQGIKGLGRIMVDKRIESLQSRAQFHGFEWTPPFLEIDDPEKVAAEPGKISPSKRLEVFNKWGAKLINVNYVTPPLGQKIDHSDQLRLMCYPVNGIYAGPDETEAFLRAVYKEGRGGNPDESPYFQAMMQDITSWRDKLAESAESVIDMIEDAVEAATSIFQVGEPALT